jgi:hypothetical protein
MGLIFSCVSLSVPHRSGTTSVPAPGEQRKAPDTGSSNGISAEGQKIKSQKILLIGTLGSGKTTIAQRLARDTGLPYESIDDCRIRYGDGTVEGEDCAWENFLAICREPAPGILEFSGMGPHAEDVRENLLCSGIPVSLIWLVLPLEICIARAMQRLKKIHSPFPWAPVTYSAPLIHDEIEFSWEYIWSRESRFHATRREFSWTDSVDEMYAAVREICVVR